MEHYSICNRMGSLARFVRAAYVQRGAVVKTKAAILEMARTNAESAIEQRASCTVENTSSKTADAKEAIQMNTDTTIDIRAANGVPFRVRLVRKNEKYGLHRVLVHSDARPMVEFYDLRYPMHGEPGQFVSRYYVSAALAGDAGLCLDGGNAAQWSVDGDSMALVRAWLTHQVRA